MQFSTIPISEEHIIYKSKLSFAFVNLRPFLPHHILVCPIRVEPRYKNLFKEEINDLSETIHMLTNSLDCLGLSWNINLQDGKYSGQTIEHVHFHVIPRNENDLARNDDVYDKIDNGYECRDRTYEEMKEEAKLLKVSNRIEAYIQSKVLHKTLESVLLYYRRKCEDGISERDILAEVNKDRLSTTIE